MKNIPIYTLIFLSLFAFTGLDASSKNRKKSSKSNTQTSAKSSDTSLSIGDSYVYSLSNGGQTLKQYNISDLSLVNSVDLTGRAKSVIVSGDIPLLIIQSSKNFTLVSYNPTSLTETGSLAFDRKSDDIDDDDDDSNDDSNDDD